MKITKRKAVAIGDVLSADQLAGKADLLPPITIDANTALTAAHANRTLYITSATPVTLTFTVGTSLPDDLWFTFMQLGAGAATVNGAVALAPGVASMTTNGVGSQLVGFYAAALGVLTGVFRNAASIAGSGAPGGSGPIAAYSSPDSVVVPNTGGEQTVLALPIGPAIGVGTLQIMTAVQIGEQQGAVTMRVYLNGLGAINKLAEHTFADWDKGRIVVDHVLCRAANIQALNDVNVWSNNSGNTGLIVQTADMSGNNSLLLTIDKSATAVGAGPAFRPVVVQSFQSWVSRL
jgi:hypothetical protein